MLDMLRGELAKVEAEVPAPFTGHTPPNQTLSIILCTRARPTATALSLSPIPHNQLEGEENLSAPTGPKRQAWLPETADWPAFGK